MSRQRKPDAASRMPPHTMEVKRMTSEFRQEVEGEFIDHSVNTQKAPQEIRDEAPAGTGNSLTYPVGRASGKAPEVLVDQVSPVAGTDDDQADAAEV